MFHVERPWKARFDMSEDPWLSLIPDSDIVTTPYGTSCSLAAATDAEAIRVWLQVKASRSRHTFIAYRKEALRFLVWMNENDLTLKELRIEHAHDYFAHLADPPIHWIRPSKPRKDEQLEITQLVLGPQSNRSIEYCRTVLQQMSGYLVDAGYLSRNIFKLTMKLPVVTQTVHTRLLDLDSWIWFWNWLLAMPQETPRKKAHAARCRWLFALLYHTGIRLEEAAKARMKDFVKGEIGWSLRVIGKGRKERMVTANSTLIEECLLYRRFLKLPHPYPSPLEECPLIGSLHTTRTQKVMTPRAVALIVSTVADQAAETCEDPYIYAKLKDLSTRWMRHTNATHRLFAGASLDTTQDELGHSDPRTTRIYAATLDEQRQIDAEKLVQLLKK